MTLDETIKYCEKVAEEQRSYAHKCEGIIVVNQTIKERREELINKYIECAEEHKQLAEWLKELKRLKEKEPCEDVISRELAISTIKSMSNANPSYWNECDVVDRENLLEEFEEFPSVQPTKPKIGHWNIYVLRQSGIDEEWLECSECMWSNALLIPRNYCPKCGTRMIEREVQDDSN